MKKKILMLTTTLIASQAVAGGGSAPMTGRSIASLLANDPNYSTLLTAVQAAGLTDTLSSGSYTVFAPSNAAFAKLPKAELTKLLNNREQLRALLLGHVVAGKVSAKQVSGLKTVKTAAGTTLNVALHGNRVMIGNAHVTKADWAASNGVIHAVDAVIMPAPVATRPAAPAAAATRPATPVPTLPATPSATPSTHASNMTITAPARPVATAPVTETTEAAPATETTEAAPVTETTEAAPVTETTEAAPVTETTATTSETPATTPAEAAATASTTVGSATVSTQNVGTENVAAENIVSILTNNPDFSTLLQAVTAAELVSVLGSEGPFTVFAPTNEAFAKLPQADLQALVADKEALRAVLLGHVVAGKVDAQAVTKLSSAQTAANTNVAIKVEGNTVKVGDATVTTVDIPASNGIIHVIDTVILPQK